jgi:hypothetical protein
MWSSRKRDSERGCQRRLSQVNEFGSLLGSELYDDSYVLAKYFKRSWDCRTWGNQRKRAVRSGFWFRMGRVGFSPERTERARIWLIIWRIFAHILILRSTTIWFEYSGSGGHFVLTLVSYTSYGCQSLNSWICPCFQKSLPDVVLTISVISVLLPDSGLYLQGFIATMI